MSYFGRLTYSYDKRYSIQANFRADAYDASKLSKENRWGYFPSVSAGWTLSNESFIKDNISESLFHLRNFVDLGDATVTSAFSPVTLTEVLSMLTATGISTLQASVHFLTVQYRAVVYLIQI